MASLQKEAKKESNTKEGQYKKDATHANIYAWGEMCTWQGGQEHMPTYIRSN